MRKKELMTIVAIITLSVGFGVGIIYLHNNRACDTIITFTDGTTVSCKGSRSMDNCITRYWTCDNESIKVPTIRIKEIKK